MRQSTGSQSIRHDRVTEQQSTYCFFPGALSSSAFLSQPITEKGDGDTDSFKGRKKGKEMEGGRK